MTDLGLMDDEEPRPARRNRRRRRKRRRGGSVMAVLLSLAVVGTLGYGIYYGGSQIFDAVGEWFADGEDYPGPGSGEVEVTIESGSSLRAMGTTLVEAGVVASQDAFVSAADDNPDAGSIQPGTYTLRNEMSAEGAIDMMLETTTVVSRAAVPEGYRVRQTVSQLAEETEFAEEELQSAVDGAELPEYTEGDPEGFLFPATYDLHADTNAGGLIDMMVNRFGRAAEDVGLEAAATDRDMTMREMVTVASIIEREVSRPEDMPRVADVIYNRLSGACAEQGVPADGMLQMDSTVHYAIDEYSSVFTSDEDRNVDSPYNTYRYPGLPPGPIASPGEQALQATASPAGGSDCYFVAVDLETGETAFAVTPEDHNANVARLEEYCTTSDLC